MFEDLSATIKVEVVRHLFHVEVEDQDAHELAPDHDLTEFEYEHEQTAGSDAIAAAGGAAVATAGTVTGGASTVTSASSGGSSTSTATTPRHEQRADVEKVGRNQPCPCGSGKKYKRCHGA